MTSSKDIREGSPRMPNKILFKLFGFTALLFFTPMLSFFASKNYLFTKNAELYSGVIAVVMVNLVILVYILLIFNDDEEMGTNAPTNNKKLKLKEKEEDSKDSKGSGKKENSSARKLPDYLDNIHKITENTCFSPSCDLNEGHSSKFSKRIGSLMFTAALPLHRKLRMNLTIVKELLALYKTEPNTQIYINEAKLALVCDKIKLKTQSESKNSRVTSSKMNNSQLASACWNLLVQINRNTSASFSTQLTFLQTAKIVLGCAKIIEMSAGDFKMGPLDLEKMVANLIAKLSEGLKIALDSSEEQSLYIINLMEFFFERLQKHFNSLEGGMRRMSLLEFPSIDDPFVDVNFHGLCPENAKDPTLRQLAIVALESLCRISLLFQKGHIESILDALKPFHIASNSEAHIVHFISSVCKLEFWSFFEWKFWNWISGHEIYNQYLIYFKKRCHLKLSPPVSCDKLSMKIVAAVLTSGQLTDEMIDVIRNDEVVDEVVGPCLSLLLKEENYIYISRIDEVLRNITLNSVSATALRSILSALDSLRNGLFHLIRNDSFFSLLEALNDFLLRVDFPVKFYVSWTSQVLKAVVENRRQSPQVKELVKVSIKGLLSHENIPEDMQSKFYKIISQSLSIAADPDLLRCFISINSENLGSILESSHFNLQRDYFIELSRSVFCVNLCQSLYVSWIKVLSSQVSVPSKTFECENVLKLHFMAKLISNHIFDQVKLAHYLELIYAQMRKLGFSDDSLMLSKQLIAFKNPKATSLHLNNYKFSNQFIQSIVQVIKLYHETGAFDISMCDFSVLRINDDIEAEIYFYFLNLTLVRASKDEFRNIISHFDKFDGIYDHMMELIEGYNCDYWAVIIEGTSLSELHSHYQKGNYGDALKIGYERLKSSLKTVSSGIEKTLETIELIVYLHRLSVSTRNISESRYFLKQLFQLADALKSENIKLVADSLQKEFLKLTGDSTRFIDYLESEKILKSPSYRPFYFEYDNLMELDKIRQQIKSAFQAPTSQYPISCNGIMLKSFRDSMMDKVIKENLKSSLENLKKAQNQKMNYSISEWAKISLFFKFHKSLQESCDSELLDLFELARNPNNCGTVCLNRLKGSIGILHDQFLSIIWILVVTFDSKLLLFKLNINKSSFPSKVQKIHEICSQNTDSLRNTTEMAKDAGKKAQWWKLRKSLDSDLISLCSELDEELFSHASEIVIPNSNSSLPARNLYIHLKELLTKLSNGTISVSEAFAGQLIQWGQFPKRHKIENLVKMIQFSMKFSSHEDKFSSEEIDLIVLKIRKCFENSFDVGLCSLNSVTLSSPFNLLLDKDLNIVPFESLPIFNKFTFKRIPLIHYANSEDNSEVLKNVFYIVNPSGDLVQTQERFENIFKGQPNWNGVIGRKPTAEEFFNGICGFYDLFIYFGHSSGEIYAPLKELKLKLSKRASSALLIGCSSGRIKSNGIFPPESSIFHYLENGSPLVLANLWDVTDKDIDMYIKGVLEDSDLLLPIGGSENLVQTTANCMTIIEKAHWGRQRCMLKALNGFAPIVYALI